MTYRYEEDFCCDEAPNCCCGERSLMTKDSDKEKMMEAEYKHLNLWNKLEVSDSFEHEMLILNEYIDLLTNQAVAKERERCVNKADEWAEDVLSVNERYYLRDAIRNGEDSK